MIGKTFVKKKVKDKIAKAFNEFNMWHSLKARIALFTKGMAMGAADVVPGVSGGTMAFITNIYEQLIKSLNNIDLTALRYLITGQVRKLNDRINGFFLITILLGVLTAVFTLAKLVLFLLNNHPILVWSFFMGLIMASAWVVAHRIKKWGAGVFVTLTLGTALAYFITESGIVNTPDTGVYIFLAGLVSIMAMILPGISGSFLLVVMGKYELIISSMSSVAEAIKNLVSALIQGHWGELGGAFQQAELLPLLFFYTGTLTGLLTFAKVLNWLFQRFHDLTVATLTGFLLGSLNKVWPWKETLSYYKDRHGAKKPLEQENILPHSFDAEVLMALGLTAIGFILVVFIERTSTHVKKAA